MATGIISELTLVFHEETKFALETWRALLRCGLDADERQDAICEIAHSDDDVFVLQFTEEYRSLLPDAGAASEFVQKYDGVVDLLGWRRLDWK